MCTTVTLTTASEAQKRGGENPISSEVEERNQWTIKQTLTSPTDPEQPSSSELRSRAIMGLLSDTQRFPAIPVKQRSDASFHHDNTIPVGLVEMQQRGRALRGLSPFLPLSDILLCDENISGLKTSESRDSLCNFDKDSFANERFCRPPRRESESSLRRSLRLSGCGSPARVKASNAFAARASSISPAHSLGSIGLPCMSNMSNGSSAPKMLRNLSVQYLRAISVSSTASSHSPVVDSISPAARRFEAATEIALRCSSRCSTHSPHSFLVTPPCSNQAFKAASLCLAPRINRKVIRPTAVSAKLHLKRLKSLHAGGYRPAIQNTKRAIEKKNVAW